MAEDLVQSELGLSFSVNGNRWLEREVIVASQLLHLVVLEKICPNLYWLTAMGAEEVGVLNGQEEPL